MKVSKFGGTSVASAVQIKKVAEIVKANHLENSLLCLHQVNASIPIKK